MSKKESTEAKNSNAESKSDGKAPLSLADVQAFMEANDVNVAFYRQRKGQGIRVQVNTRKAEGRPGVRLASEASPDLSTAVQKAIRETKRELEP
jgi:hypothetical protein